MSKQINNALSISRESGKSVKLESYTASRPWRSQHPPTPKLIQETVDFSYNLGKDQELWRPDGKHGLLCSPVPSKEPAEDTLKGAGVQWLSPGVPRSSFPYRPSSLPASQVRGETGLASTAPRARQRGTAMAVHRKRSPSPSQGKNDPEVPVLHHHFSLTSPKAADLSPIRAQKKNTVFAGAGQVSAQALGPLPAVGRGHGSRRLGLPLAPRRLQTAREPSRLFRSTILPKWG